MMISASATSTTARTSFIAQPNATISSTSTSNSNQSAPSSHTMPPELESTLSLLSSHRTVLGYLLLSRGHPASIIRHSGVIFEGEQGKKYASAISRIVESVQSGLEEVKASELDHDEVKFMRVRTKRHELMISPDDRYLLAVLHDPTS